MMELSERSDPMSVVLDYCHTVNSNIELFLKDKTRKLEINLENIDRDFIQFWRFIGAEGDIDAALAEFNIRYNASKKSERDIISNAIPRLLLKLKRLIIKLPSYLRDD